MTERNLIALPLGEYELTDGLYTYTLTKSMSAAQKEMGIESRPIYFIYPKGGSMFAAHITMFEDKLDVYDDDAPYCMRRKFFRKILTSISGCGAISIHSKDTYRAIRDLRFVGMPYIYNRIPNLTPATNNTIN